MDILPNWGCTIYLGDSFYKTEGVQFIRILGSISVKFVFLVVKLLSEESFREVFIICANW